MPEPRRILVFGNSGAGKSTLAKSLASRRGLAHLDLDTLAWRDTQPPARRELTDSKHEMDTFTREHGNWVIEGCYADLLDHLLPVTQRLIFLDPGTERCVAHARGRPWEPHKYSSKAAQDANLDMLIEWITAYDTRTDTFSRGAHEALYARFPGEKQRLTEPPTI